jgi:Concanavalin A-like lectin/glucanases superfamily
MVSTSRLGAGIGAVLLVAAACWIFLSDPWHGPTLLSLSPSHGIDAGDLPGLALLALALAAARRLTRGSGSTGPLRRLAGPASAIVLGGLLLAALLPDPTPTPLLPAAGGTFRGATLHTDGQQADPLRRWSHLAVTYDGTVLKLFVNGDQVSSRATRGAIRSTPDPLWIGANHPYGEYFHGLIDEVRIYDRALSRSALRTEMATPIGSATGPTTRGLVAAWAFDRGSGRRAADASGAGNDGTLIGPTWTTRGRFGHALRFDGAGAAVRVPASSSLDLSEAMTLSAWIRPAGSQAGWRTVVHRQTDAYFLMAGGGGGISPSPTVSDGVRAALAVGAAACLCMALVAGWAPWLDASVSWWPPITLFLAGSAVDVWVSGPGTVIGPTLVAIWCAFTTRRHAVAMSMFVVAAVLTGVTVVALASQTGYELARGGGGVARSAALGLVLVASGMAGVSRRGTRGSRVPLKAETRLCKRV